MQQINTQHMVTEDTGGGLREVEISGDSNTLNKSVKKVELILKQNMKGNRNFSSTTKQLSVKLDDTRRCCMRGCGTKVLPRDLLCANVSCVLLLAVSVISIYAKHIQCQAHVRCRARSTVHTPHTVLMRRQ